MVNRFVPGKFGAKLGVPRRLILITLASLERLLRTIGAISPDVAFATWKLRTWPLSREAREPRSYGATRRA
jgi:hypothetical protein